MADFAGFSSQDLADFFGISPTQAAALALVAMGGAPSADLQGIDPSRLNPGGDIVGGLQHLSEHPKGSHYHGDFNVKDIGLNLATGGFYGLGKGLYNTTQTGKLSDAFGGLNQLGPWGSTVAPVNKNIAMTGNLIGAGAGIGGGIASGQGIGGGGFGAAPSGAAAPASGFPFAIEGPLSASVPSYPGIALSDPLMAQAYPGFGAALGYGAGATGGSGSGGFGASLGAGVGQQAGKFIGGMMQPGPNIPATFPMGGALPSGPNPAQISALASEKHPGLAPWYGLKQQGQMPPGGIAEMGQNEALSTMAQNPSLWMRG